MAHYHQSNPVAIDWKVLKSLSYRQLSRRPFQPGWLKIRILRKLVSSLQRQRQQLNWRKNWFWRKLSRQAGTSKLNEAFWMKNNKQFNCVSLKHFHSLFITSHKDGIRTQACRFFQLGRFKRQKSIVGHFFRTTWNKTEACWDFRRRRSARAFELSSEGPQKRHLWKIKC